MQDLARFFPHDSPVFGGKRLFDGSFFGIVDLHPRIFEVAHHIFCSDIFHDDPSIGFAGSVREKADRIDRVFTVDAAVGTADDILGVWRTGIHSPDWEDW